MSSVQVNTSLACNAFWRITCWQHSFRIFYKLCSMQRGEDGVLRWGRSPLEIRLRRHVGEAGVEVGELLFLIGVFHLQARAQLA